jgi:hypothetical protein
MHVQPAKTDPSRNPDDVARNVQHELARKKLLHDHTSPEEIAVVAVRELQRGRLADAQLWLSVASYRYHQEVIEAIDEGEAGIGLSAMYGVPRDTYMKLVLAEVRRFADLGFHDEVAAIEARRQGRDEKERALQQQLASLGQSDPIDRENLRDVWSELRPEADDAADATHYPELVAAFRRRLRQDADDDPEDRNPPIYLARSPAPAMKKEAIYSTGYFFEPVLCEGVAEAFPGLRPAMLTALSASRPQARANAAATLGMAPSDEAKAALHARLATETDARVKLALSYGLVLHGEAEQALPITTAVQSCKGEACTLPVTLLLWMPASFRKDLEQAPLARIVGDKKAEIRTRLMAASILRAIGRDKPLEPAALEALITAARFKREDNERFQIVAAEAVQDTSTLARADVLARLAPQGGSGSSNEGTHQDVLHPCALVARLARLALADDLPLIKRLMARFGDGDGPEPFFLVEAALEVHDAQSDAMLENWFVRYPKLQAQIIAGLAERDSVSPDDIARLLSRGGVRARLVYMAIKHEDARNAVIGYLQSANVEDRFQAAEVAGLSAQTGVSEYLYPLTAYTDARYYPNDALLRHTAMAAIVRIALAGTKALARTPAAGATAAPAAPATTAPAAATPAEPTD